MRSMRIRSFAVACVLASSLLGSAPPAVSAAMVPREVSLVEDIVEGPNHSYPSNLTVIEEKVFLSAGFEWDRSIVQTVWVSDGTPRGTKPLVPQDALPINPGAFTAVGSTVFFVARDYFPDTGFELWVTDGTPSGTRLVKDISPDNFSSLGTDQELAVLGGKACFPIGASVWCSDGTEAGTQEVVDLTPGNTGGSIGKEMQVLGDHAYFAAHDGVHGRELWKTDGTPEGTVLVDDATPGPNGTSPEDLLVFGGRLYFRSGDHPTVGSELWASDGTEGGTSPVKDIDDGSEGSHPQDMTSLGDKLYFSANDGINGVELWATDGTDEGSVMVANIATGAASSVPTYLAAVRDELFFSADDGTHGFELWKHSPTSGDTALVRDIVPSDVAFSNSFPQHITEVGDVAYFEAADWTTGGGLTGGELWRSDGTPEGTTLARDINPGAEGSLIEEMTEVGGSLFLPAFDPDHGVELWRADPPQLSIRAAQVVEGDTGRRTMLFKAKLSRVPDLPVKVTFATVDGAAEAGKDYIAHTGTVTIPGGERSAKIPVKILGDNRRERNESFSLVAGQVGRHPTDIVKTARGRIVNDD
jgi:ELWxxDGT repeat protein